MAKMIYGKLKGLALMVWAHFWIVFAFLTFPDFLDWYQNIFSYWFGYYVGQNDLGSRWALSLLSFVPVWLLLTEIAIGVFVLVYSIKKLVASRRRRVGAVSGGFDPINGRGHMSHITEAMKRCDRLVVILSRDDQLLMKKERTFYPSYIERKLIIQGILGNKGEVVMNEDVDGGCAETLRKVKPRWFFKGGDRTPDNMPQAELDACREIGCKIVYNVGFLKYTSSQELVRKAGEK